MTTIVSIKDGMITLDDGLVFSLSNQSITAYGLSVGDTVTSFTLPPTEDPENRCLTIFRPNHHKADITLQRKAGQWSTSNITGTRKQPEPALPGLRAIRV